MGQGPVDKFGLLSTWEDVFHGGHCFLVLGGPSINRVVPDLKMLQDRGIATFGLNNVSAAIRTNFWTYGDSSRKFHDAIWKDPGIVKFVPAPKMKHDRVWSKPGPNQKPIATDKFIQDCPGVVGVYRNSDMQPEKYLWEDTINWGVGADSLCKRLKSWIKEHLGWPEDMVKWKTVEPAVATGRIPREVFDRLCPFPKVLSTMFQAVRLVYFLGFRNCYLLGADFSMEPEKRYSFDETGNIGTVRGNNGAYPKINAIFHALRPEFDKAGFRVLNLNSESQLTAFDYMSFDDAYGWAREGFPKVIDTKGWYEKD